MKNKIVTLPALSILIVAVAAFSGTGKYYGLFWDGAEHLVSLNPYNSHKTILDTIPNVNLIAAGNSAYDTDSNRYVFIGGSSASSMMYNVIDAQSGTVLSQTPRTDNINSIAYSPIDKMFYGLWWDGSKEYLVSIDPYTSTKTLIDSIPDVHWISAFNYAFDTDSNRYVFIGGPTTGAMSYYVVDASTGVVVSQSLVGTKIDNIAYSSKDRAYYGITWDGAEHSVVVNPYTSGYTILDTIASVHWIDAANYAFDTDSVRYVFIGGETGAMAYNVIDVQTGATLSQNPQGDIIRNLRYAGVTTPEEDAAEAEAEAANAAPTRVQLNPLKTSFSVQSLQSGVIALDIRNGNGEGFSFAMNDLSGKAVLKRDGIRTNRVRIDASRLNKGLYFYQVKGNRGAADAGKIVVK